MTKLSKPVATIETLKRLVTNSNNKYATKDSLSTVATTGNYSDLKGAPTSLPANGGNASTVNGHTVNSDVPADAKFTDTVYTHPNSGVTAGTYKSVTVNAQGHVTTGTNPTTLSGYGITDAKIANGVITLGANSITPLTSHQSLANYYTKSEVNSQISSIPKFAIEVVNSLPTTNISSTTVYLLLTSNETQNLYTEYIYVNDAWEKLGSQTLDLSGYALKSDITTGSSNGTIAVDGTDVPVAGLQSGAFNNAYVHPTTSGNKHIPSGGSSGQILKWSADGTATWAAEYSYTHPTTAGNKHIPSGGSSGQILRYSSSGTAVWGNETTYDTMTATEATTGTDTTGKLISPKVLADYVAANAGGTGTYYGTCATAASTAVKVVTCADFTSLTTGASISVKFTYTNTAASPTMNVNSTGAKAIYYHNANVGANKILANTVYNFVYDGSYWQLIDTAYPLYYGACSTAAGTKAKVVSCAGFALITGAEITVKFTVTNTAASPTLNVNSTGAKSIYYKGAAITAGYLAANKIYKFVYDGSYWQLVGDVDTDTTYTAMTQAVATAGTSTTANTISAKVLNDTIDAKINEIEIADYKDY